MFIMGLDVSFCATFSIHMSHLFYCRSNNTPVFYQDFFNEAVNFSRTIDFSESQVVETVRSVFKINGQEGQNC